MLLLEIGGSRSPNHLMPSSRMDSLVVLQAVLLLLVVTLHPMSVQPHFVKPYVLTGTPFLNCALCQVLLMLDLTLELSLACQIAQTMREHFRKIYELEYQSSSSDSKSLTVLKIQAEYKNQPCGLEQILQMLSPHIRIPELDCFHVD